MADDSQSGSPDKDQAAKLEIDGKVFTADDVKGMLAQQADLTQKSQVASKLLTATGRYNVDPDVYLQNAEASFALMNELIHKGIIDETGKIVDKKMDTSLVTQQQQFQQMPQQQAGTRADQTAMKALEDFHGKFGNLEKELQTLREDNLNLMRLRISDQLASKFPDLDEQDISRVIATAYSSGSKRPVMEVAEEMVKSKQSWLSSQEKAWAEKYGLNYDELNKRKQFIEQGPEGGLGGMVAGKKVSFQSRGKDPNAVTPRQATKAFFELQEKYRRE